MFSRLRNVMVNVVGPPQDGHGTSDHSRDQKLEPKFPYTRPHFLGLDSIEEIKASADHGIRPIIVPRDSSALPWNTGYAECVSSGKTMWNEDMAVERRYTLRKVCEGENGGVCVDLPYNYFALFDGHAGYGASVAASNQFHHILNEKLVDTLDDLLPTSNLIDNCSKDSLIIGALETAFLEMDQLIADDATKYHMPGGCTALVVVMILNRIYVANAGDSRAIACLHGFRTIVPLTTDHTPENERQRILQLGHLRPELLGKEFTCREYVRRPTRQDLGKRAMYRDPAMAGWGYKTLSADDLKISIICGRGKRSRVMGTIGVARGFGDHELRAIHTNVCIKPFLSAHPEVKVLNLEEIEIAEDDVIIMATDGFWDVMTNEKATQLAEQYLRQFEGEKYRFTSTAQQLVAKARGKLQDDTSWRTTDDHYASLDDISLFVIPLRGYYLQSVVKQEDIYQIEKTD